MTSIREQIMGVLTDFLAPLECRHVRVCRNPDKPQCIPSDGLIVIRDGACEESESFLSPRAALYEFTPTIEVIVQNPHPKVRIHQVDALLMAIGRILETDHTLDGLVEWLEARPPEFREEPIEGAATIRSATVPIKVQFFSENPLS